MKKIAIALTLCALLFAAACGGSPAPAETTAPAEMTAAPATTTEAASTEAPSDATTAPSATEAQGAAEPVTTAPAAQAGTEPATTVAATEPATTATTAAATEPTTEPVTTAAATEPPAQGKYQDGTFTGGAWGYESDIYVAVTIANDVITAIEVTDHADDDIYVQDALLILPKVIAAQSADVDAISGATATCDGIKGAIRAALKKAEN